MIEELKNYPDINFIFESRCLFSGTEMFATLLKLPNVRIIFDISFTKVESFSVHKRPLNPLLPAGNLPEIEEKIKSLPEREKVYIQFTRTTENENELMQFYERWSDYSDRIIIKKPDMFGGILNEYRSVDLSPVKRFPCLHLKHDMVIFYDGSVPLCRQDFNGNIPMGNILKDGLDACWEKMNSCYKKQWNENYTPLCEKCDEWWVFNL
jgi:spiro-SPASM protein